MFASRKQAKRSATKASVNLDTGSSSSQSFTNIPTLPASPEPGSLLSAPVSPRRIPDVQSHDQDTGEVAGSDYAKRCKALMELYRELRSLGTEMFFKLPKIAVIGAQSAGKSSLIETVSGISVPRDSGICTRCPVDLSMTSFVDGDEWSCTILLRIEYDQSGQQQASSTRIPFCTLSSNEKQSVDLWLRRAQASILCRQRPISDFQNMNLEELRRLKPGDGSMLSFSMNVIEVHLKDPEATDLTFVDLPGLIQNAPKDEITVAQKLVKENIKGDKTLILVTIPMSDEMENQEAARLARETDPSGDRTIGVLTKPDTITRGAIGSRQRWKDVLQGKSYSLRHGYYCVRLADDDERAKKLSRTESEALSAEFFARNEPWNDFVDQSRFGVPNFVKDISRLLLGLIETNIPPLKVALDQLILEFSNELEVMPIAPTGEPSTEILLRLSDFCREVHEAVMGKDHKFLVHNNKHHYEVFRRCIERTNPDFWPFNSKKNHRNPGLHILGGSVGPFDLQDIQNEITEALTWELPGIIPYDAIKSLVSKSTTTWRAPTVECFDSVFQSTSLTVEILIARHFKQFTKLETLIKALCHSELNVCRAEAMSLLEKLLLHESIPLYTQNITYLKQQKSKWLRQYTKIHANSSQYLHPAPPQTLAWGHPKAYSLPVSDNPRSSQYVHPAPQPTSSFLGELRTPKETHSPPVSRSSSPVRSVTTTRSRSISPVSRKSSPVPIATIAPRNPLSQLPLPPTSNSYDDELSVMATVTAYFEIASKRFIDHIPLAIEHQLNQVFSQKIHQTLIEDIMSGPDVPGRMKDLLSEDKDIALRRQFLKQRLQRLGEIKEKLSQFDLTASNRALAQPGLFTDDTSNAD